MECIATHLDVEAGLLEVWQKLAACLLYLSQQWDKELAKGTPTTVGQTSGIMEGAKEIVEGQSSSQNGYFTDWRENMWGDRKVWWRQKHFHEKSVDIEQQIDGKFLLILVVQSLLESWFQGCSLKCVTPEIIICIPRTITRFPLTQHGFSLVVSHTTSSILVGFWYMLGGLKEDCFISVHSLLEVLK